MLRRPFTEEPVSRLASWSSRLGWFSLAVAALSIIILRSGFLEIVPSLATFAAALVFAVLAILFALASSVVIWRLGFAGIGRAVTGFLIGCGLLAYPGYLGVKAYKLPPITDVTTDPANPPRFDVIARLRPRGTSDYPRNSAVLQRTAYPNVVPLQVLTNPKATYDAVLSVVTKRRWVIVDARPPTPSRREGTIEAVARTIIMGFRDDVSIRVTPLGTGAQIDVRSASRYGSHDFGANAARVVALLDDIDDAAGAAGPEPKPEPEKVERKPQKRQAPSR
ncbi:MAG: DUF1499 domain-containing protein [Pseudolabrys sp.]